MNQTKIFLLGVESFGELSEQTIARIKSCKALVLSRRHQDMLSPILGDLEALARIPIAPVRQALHQVELVLTSGDVAILATGDPLFFGIGRTLLDYFGPERLLISPALSSMQLAFSRFKIPWDDAQFFSLHGHSTATDGLVSRAPRTAQERPRTSERYQESTPLSRPLLPLLLNRDKLFLFTDHRSSPDRISQTLLDESGQAVNRDYLVHVAENLGLADEKLHTGTFAEIAKRTFGPLTVMIIIKTSQSHPANRFGLTEDEIVHSRGLITKNEVRAATLHALRLPDRGVFWDVGGGSGAISLEVARLFPALQVLTVEREDEQIANIQKNRDKFQAWNLQWIQGSAPDVLTSLPDPDRVFIGGSGGHLRAIIEYATRRMRPDGLIVVNAVLEKTAQDAPRFLHENGWCVTTSEIKVTRRRYPQATDGPVSRDPGMDQERPQATDGPVSRDADSQTLHPITIVVGRHNRFQTKTNS
jgi:precorrin-6B C5,15-methyltransferase / cobalt-precorrin-6B C5,C15-methyltransferase